MKIRSFGAFKLTLVTAALGLSSSAIAEVLQYKFTDTDGLEKSVSSSIGYVNPKAAFTVSISAGIDRKVKVTLLKEDDTPVSTATSKLIGSADRITIADKSYYGAELRLTKPVDGSYKLVTETLSSKDVVVSSETVTLVVDSSPPVLGAWSWGMNYGRGTAPDGLPIFSTVEAKHITLNVADSNDVSKATYETFEHAQDGSVKQVRQGIVNVIAGGNKVMLGTGSINSIGNAQFPIGVQGRYSIKFIVEDKAGNHSNATLNFWNNSKCGPAPEPVAIQDSSYTGAGYMGVSGFRSLEGQSTTPVSQNPARVMFRLPNKEVQATDEGKIFGGLASGAQDYTIVKSEGGLTYFIVKETIKENGQMNYQTVGWTNNSTWRCNALAVKSPVFSDATKPPVQTSISPYIEGYGWLPLTVTTKGGSFARDLTISKIKVTAEPRAYNQVAGIGYGASCAIPAGASECIADTNLKFNTTGTASYYHTRPALYPEGHPEARTFTDKTTFVWEWDGADPVVDQLVSHDTLNKVVVFSGTELFSGSTWGRVIMAAGGLVAKNATGTEVKLSSSQMTTSGNNSVFTTSYKSLKSGTWNIFGWAQDNYGNYGEKELFSINNDGESPTVRFNTPNANIVSLDDIKIVVGDDVTERPKITSVKLEGGPSNSVVYLAVREITPNEYNLEYPVIFPSLGAGYKLTVTVQDESGNTTTNKLDFKYEPPTVGLEEDGFGIPSVGQYAWVHANGKFPFYSETLTNYEGTPLTGSYELTGTLRLDSTSGPISINGVILKPGETKNIGSFDFTSSKGHLALPVYSVKNGNEGVANLLVTSGAPGASIVVGSFNVWSPKVSVDPFETKLDGRVLIDVFSIALKDSSGKCNWRPKSEINSISSVDIISSPACFNTALENGLEFYQDKNYSVLQSRLAQVTSTYIPAGSASGAKMKGTYLNSSGSREQVVIELPVESVELKLNARDASDSIKFGDDSAKITLYRSIQSINQSLVQTSGPSCGSITNSETEAKASGAKMNAEKGIASVACYFKWLSAPPGVETIGDEQKGYSFSGTVSEIGTYPIAWELVAYSPLGEAFPVTLSKQTMTVDVVNPPPPSIDVQSTRLIAENLYTVQKKPTNIGTVNFVGLAEGAVVYKVLRGGTVIADSSDKAEYAKKTASYRLNSETQGSLWANQSYTLMASYVKLPDITIAKEIRTVSVPDDDMSMKVNTELSKALSSDTIPVTVGFYNKSNVNTPYNVADAGDWSVRLVDVKSAKNRHPISSWVPVNSDGTVTIDLPLNLSAGDTMHVGSEGTLASQQDGFEMSKTSANTVTITVLDASPVQGELKSYKVSGVAPLAVSTSLVSDQKDLVSLVEWQLSEDNGASWKGIEGSPTVASKMLSHVYDVGIHQVRARLTNKYSGVQSYTSTLQIQAYNVPNARYIKGPTVMLMGQQGDMYVTDKEGNRLTDSNEIVYEWSTDRGETWAVSEDKYVFNHTSEIGNYPLWARIRYASSPAEDSYAYKIVKTAVSVRKTAKVTIGLVGTSQPEVGKSNLYAATVNLPYSNMQGQVVGRFTLPDGSIVDGFTLDYRPTVKPSGTELILFEAWIEGYETDSKRTVTKKLRAWEYAWPVFSLRAIDDPGLYAPMSLDMRVESVGSTTRIEELSYEWELPESGNFVMTNGRLDTRRVASVTAPGTYPVKVTISDARGNRTVLEQDFVISKAPPWIIDLQWTGSNSTNRATLNIRTKPQITRGHKYDSIKGYSYKVNGKEVAADSRYVNLDFPTPGRYTLALDLTTELGFGSHGQTEIEVVENKIPVCEFAVKQTSTAYVVSSKCGDEDGKMASYEWSIDNQIQAIRGSSISISKRSYPVKPKIQLVGVDDSAGRSNPVTW